MIAATIVRWLKDIRGLVAALCHLNSSFRLTILVRKNIGEYSVCR